LERNRRFPRRPREIQSMSRHARICHFGVVAETVVEILGRFFVDGETTRLEKTT
jgi:hypothetical protein